MGTDVANDDTEMPTVFSCPTCRVMLEKRAADYRCAKCQQEYPVVEGIPVFSDMSTYYGEVSKNHMTSLIQEAQEHGYKETLKKHFNNPFVFKYTFDETRAKWIDVIPHDSSTRLLDVGCGWGTNSVPISRKVGRVDALDATYERVKFVQIRATQESIDNIFPVMGSAVTLPFPDASFDVIAFNGVLEWLGAIDKNVDPKKIQLQALDEAHRVLKPGGCIYIGIENRYSLRYFLGDADDHSFIRFTSLMPRAMANAYCRLRKRDRYFTHTHSLGVYRQMLADSGFGSVTEYLPWPTYRNPDSHIPLVRKELGPFLQKAAVAAWKSSKRRWVYIQLLRLITKIEGQGRMLHSFCFVAEKQPRDSAV